MVNKSENRRLPGVSGTFYPAGRREVTDLMEKLSGRVRDNIAAIDIQGKITGGIVPHAGIRFCGRQAVCFFESVKRKNFLPDTVVILHPNHYGHGPGISTDGHEYWEVSNGVARVDQELVRELGLPVSSEAQKKEHSAEVIIPYLLHYLPPAVSMVSINMLDQDFLSARDLALKIFAAATSLKREIILIASTDFSHFVSRSVANDLDNIVLREIESRNTGGVCRQVKEKGISVCGYGPVMTLMEYSSLVDPGYRFVMLSRGDSGEVTGDSSNVVSYISALFSAAEG